MNIMDAIKQLEPSSPILANALLFIFIILILARHYLKSYQLFSNIKQQSIKRIRKSIATTQNGELKILLNNNLEIIDTKLALGIGIYDKQYRKKALEYFSKDENTKNIIYFKDAFPFIDFDADKNKFYEKQKLAMFMRFILKIMTICIFIISAIWLFSNDLELFLWGIVSATIGALYMFVTVQLTSTKYLRKYNFFSDNKIFNTKYKSLNKMIDFIT